MRIIDSEAHPIIPSGLAGCYPTSPRWRPPYIPPAHPETRNIAAKSIAEGKFDDLTDRLLKQMDRHGVEMTVLMRGSWTVPTARLADIRARHPDRFVIFGSWDLHPTEGSPPQETQASLGALERNFTELGALGAGEFDLMRFAALGVDKACMGYVPTLELCRKYNKPVMFHTGYDNGGGSLQLRNPLTFEPLIAEFRDIPIMLAHMGKHDVSLFECALMLARKYTNVYLTTSNTSMRFVERTVEEIGADRLIFGSDWSLTHGILGEGQGLDVYGRNLDIIRDARIDATEKALILGGNLSRLLGI